MNTNLAIFQANLFKQSFVEHILIDGEPWFKAKQVAEILEYKDTDKAIRNNVDEADKSTLNALYTRTYLKEGAGIHGNILMINESGLYCLILRSKKKEANDFRIWVTKEVIPSIRRTGRYENMELKRQLEEAKETIHKQDKTIDWFFDHQNVDDKFYQKLPPKQMKYIPAKPTKQTTLEEPYLKQRIVKDMAPFLNNPFDFVYIPKQK